MSIQADTLMGTLTVSENIAFSAALRLPSTCTWNDRKEKVHKVINELGLKKVADTKVRNYFSWWNRVCTV